MQVHVRLAHNVLKQAVLGSNGRHPWLDAGQAPWPSVDQPLHDAVNDLQGVAWTRMLRS